MVYASCVMREGTGGQTNLRTMARAPRRSRGIPLHLGAAATGKGSSWTSQQA